MHVFFLAKHLIRILWTLKLEWDKPVHVDVKVKWQCSQNSLNQLNELQITRNAILAECIHVELHCFCNASARATSACVYLPSVNAGFFFVC